MDYNNLIEDNNIYSYKVDKYSTIKMLYLFNVENTLKNYLGLRALSSYLLKTNKKYKTKSIIKNKIKELYDFDIYFQTSLIGNKLFFSINLYFLDKYSINDNYYKELMKFINSIIFNIRYDNKILNEIKKDTIRNINIDERDISSKMYNSYLEYNYKNSDKYKRSLCNKEEIIDIINNYTIKDLKKLYSSIFDKFYKGLIFGNFNDEDYSLFKKYLPFNSNIKKLDYYKDIYKIKKKPYKEILDINSSTSRIYLTYRYKEKKLELLDYINNILNSSEGPLFKVLRSKYGLVYSFNFSYNSTEKTALLTAEISNKSKDKFIKGVNEAFSMFTNEKLLKKWLKKDKELYKDELYLLSENKKFLFDLLREYILEVYDNYTYLDFINNQDRFSEKDVIDYFNTFELINILFYKGGKNE